jgi:hypothetical protein
MRRLKLEHERVVEMVGDTGVTCTAEAHWKCLHSQKRLEKEEQRKRVLMVQLVEHVRRFSTMTTGQRSFVKADPGARNDIFCMKRFLRKQTPQLWQHFRSRISLRLHWQMR